jgi:hypothetical protein
VWRLVLKLVARHPPKRGSLGSVDLTPAADRHTPAMRLPPGTAEMPNSPVSGDADFQPRD